MTFTSDPPLCLQAVNIESERLRVQCQASDRQAAIAKQTLADKEAQVPKAEQVKLVINTAACGHCQVSSVTMSISPSTVLKPSLLVQYSLCSSPAPAHGIRGTTTKRDFLCVTILH